MFCVPGVLWLIIQSRWKEAAADTLASPSETPSAEEEVLEGRVG
jgi:hypothetical protein